MLNNITFGQYFPVNSCIHKLDARTKLLLTVAFIVFLFLADNAVALLITGLVTAFFIVLSRVPFKMYLKTIKPIIPIIVLTSILNALYVKSGTEIFSFWKISVTTGGICTAIYMAFRVCLLVISGSVLTYTTSPTDLTDAIEKLLFPLKLFRIDVHSLAMMMTIALRFIPTLIEETDKIMSAQKARGADLESGGLIKRIKALLPIIIPLLISSFRRASELADAMECRCYNGGAGRTRMKQMHFHLIDIFSFLFFGLLLGLIILVNMNCDGAFSGLVSRVISL